MIEIPASGVGLVAEHHPRPLAVAHRAGAAVGQQIDVHVLGSKQKRVVARLGQRPLALRSIHHLDRLDDFHFPGLGPGSPRESRGGHENRSCGFSSVRIGYRGVHRPGLAITDLASGRRRQRPPPFVGRQPPPKCWRHVCRGRRFDSEGRFAGRQVAGCLPDGRFGGPRLAPSAVRDRMREGESRAGSAQIGRTTRRG